MRQLAVAGVIRKGQQYHSGELRFALKDERVESGHVRLDQHVTFRNHASVNSKRISRALFNMLDTQIIAELDAQDEYEEHKRQVKRRVRPGYGSE